MRARQILVPYDGSKPSEKALREAIRLAKYFQGNVQLLLLNVVLEIMVPAVMLESRYRSRITGERITSAQMAKELCQQLKESASKMLDDKKQELMEGQARDPNIATKVLLSQPVEKAIEYADEEKVDMIAIGSIGVSGISGLKARGSVSPGIVERTKRPVLVVH
ncbi:MAG TPA: universal stress protein [Nitrososphaera sp.]